MGLGLPTFLNAIRREPGMRYLAESSAAGSGSSLTWLWILLGAVVAVGVVALVLIARYVGRRPEVVGGWLYQALDAYAQGSALHDEMSLAALPDARADDDSDDGDGDGDGDARWDDIQRRADSFAETLRALGHDAAEEDDRGRVTDVLNSLQAVRTAVNEQRAPAGASAGQAEVVRGRLLAFHQSLQELRPSQDRRFR